MHIRQHTVAVPSILLASLALTTTFGSGACGSSDSNGTNDVHDGGPDGSLINPPLGIDSRSPAPEADGVSVRAPIQVTFTEPVTLGPTPVRLVGPDFATIKTTTKLSDDGLTITVTPESPLVAPAKFSLALQDITSVARGYRPDPAPWSWTAPAWLSIKEALQNEFGSASGYPAVAAGPGERIVVASYSSNQMVVRTAADYLGKWTRVGQALNGGRETNWPSLAIDKSGGVIAAFIDGDNGHIEYGKGSDWSLVGDLHRVGGGFVTALRPPAIATDSTGKVHVGYIAQDLADGSPSRVLAGTLVNGTWSSEGDVVYQTDSVPLYYPGIAVSKDGVPYVLYQADQHAFVSVLAPDNKWHALGSGVDSSQSTGQRTAIAIDDTGKPIVLMCQQLRRWDGTNWQTIGAPLPGGCGISTFLVKTPSQNLFAFYSGSDGLHGLDVTTSSWTPVDMPTPRSTKFYATSLAVDPSGLPVIAWVDDSNINIARLNR